MCCAALCWRRSDRLLHDRFCGPFLVLHQLIFVVLGVICFVLASRTSLRSWISTTTKCFAAILDLSFSLLHKGENCSVTSVVGPLHLKWRASIGPSWFCDPVLSISSLSTTVLLAVRRINCAVGCQVEGSRLLLLSFCNHCLCLHSPKVFLYLNLVLYYDSYSKKNERNAF